MAHTNSTTNYSLPQWVGSDKPTFLGDLNTAFSDIDGQMKTNADNITIAKDTADNAQTSADDAQDDVDALALRVDTAEGNITTNATNIGLNTTAIGNLSTSISTINTALDGKQATITGGASTVTTNNLTASKVLVSDSNGKISNSTISNTELNYLSGASTNIQNKLDALSTYSDTTLTAVNGHSDYCKLFKAGHMVTFDWEWDGSLAGVTAFNIPSGYRPLYTVKAVCVSTNQKGEIEIQISTTGTVTITGGNGSTESTWGTVSYIVA